MAAETLQRVQTESAPQERESLHDGAVRRALTNVCQKTRGTRPKSNDMHSCVSYHDVLREYVSYLCCNVGVGSHEACPGM